jgi:serine/threonine-protein kinase RsbW
MGQQKLVLASTFEELEKAIDYIESFAARRGLDDDLLERLRLVGSEAVTNAIEHGNQLDQSKKVTLAISLVGDFVEMRVSDEGPGFTIDEIPDPLASENLLAEGGRGVYFIFEFSDEVIFEDGGSVLLAKFKVSKNSAGASS